ncbi:ankyrin repeat and KH domain-containing protein 1-like isoform X3 [Oscarella lobularis]|uniref:ankyrin repeat and KH domain-containing protein 1-like isoform X3 n=1 Tax=Oscarella lobularis TaxID=121494 RepID=UPI0033131BD1
MSETSALSGPAVLFQAVRSGNLIEVRRLIEDQGVAVSSEGPLDETDDIDASALHLACRLKDEEIASLLLDLGTDIESYDERGSTPLLYACELGLLSIVKKLVEAKCNVLLRNSDYMTALHYGCKAGNVEICSLLLHNGALLEAYDRFEKTPLHYACEVNNVDVVKLLVERGADIEANCDMTPFLISCNAGNIEIMKYLSEKGCNMSAETTAGAGALILACFRARTEAMDWLVSAGFSYCDTGKLGYTCLHTACLGGHLDLAVTLSNEHGLDLQQMAEDGMTPLLCAVVSDNYEIVKWLQEKGSDVWVRNKFGNGALHLALDHSNENVFGDLMVYFSSEEPTMNDFRLETINENGETLFLLACKVGLLRSVKFLYQLGADFLAKDKHGKSGLHLCCENGHTPIAEYLINELDLDPEETDYMNETSLMKACGGAHLITAEMLMKTRKWDLNMKNEKGESALHLACRHFFGTKVARYLINCGINVDEADSRGFTPMMNACAAGQLSIVRIFVELDLLSVNEKTLDRQSPLHLACEYGRHGVAQFLIDSNALLNVQDGLNSTPLSYACRSGLLLVAKRLVEKGFGLSLYRVEDCLEGILKRSPFSKGGYVNILQFLNQCNYFQNETLFRTCLRLASEFGCLSHVKFCVSLNPSLASATLMFDDQTALTNACKNKHTSVADFLIGVMSDDFSKNRHEVGPKVALAYAYENGMLSTIGLLESRGFSLDEDALVMAACKGGLVSVVKRAAEKNRSVVEKDLWKYFTEACANKRAEVAIFLIIEFDDQLLVENGRKALLVACENGCLRVVNRLIKRGCSLNNKRSDEANLLLLACRNSHANVVHLLLDAGAIVDKTELLKTACEQDLLSVVARLRDRRCSLAKKTSQGYLLHLAGGKDVAQFLVSNQPFMLNALDSNGNTPLMTACQKNKLEVASHLIQRRCSVNQKNKNDDTPFSEFLAYCWLCDVLEHDAQILLMQFISSGVQISSSSRFSKVNVLHVVAAKLFDDSEKVCTLCLEKGADPSSFNEDGKLPYECATGSVRLILREAWQRCQYSRLEDGGTKKPSKIKVCLIGAAGAGKTTLMQSLRRKRIEAELVSVSEVHVDESSDPNLRTAGIDIIQATIDEVGELVFCDFAGQPNFHKTHSLFFSGSTTVYLLVVNLEKSEQELFSSSLYWLSLTKCSIGSSNNSCVVLIGSRGDKVDGRGMLRRLKTSLMSKFEKYFEFSSENFILDCRRSSSPDMHSLRKLIYRLKTIIIEKAPATFSIVDKVQSSLLPQLRDISKKSSPLEAFRDSEIHLPKFVTVNSEDEDASFLETVLYLGEYDDARIEFPLLEKQLKVVHCRHFVSKFFFTLLIQSNIGEGLQKEVVGQFIKFLHGIGEIIEFGENIILDPSWLCHSVIGPIMSPDTFPVRLEGIDDGEVDAERVENAIRQFNKNQSFFSIEELMQLLCSLEICYPVSNEENVYRFPALIDEWRRDEFWKADENMVVYVGRRLKCQYETDIIVPGTIPFLQTRSVVRLDSSPLIWKDGMILEKRIDEITIEGLVEMDEAAKAIDVVARGPVDSEAECFDFVNKMLNMVQKVLDDRSPGTIIDHKFCLSTSALKKLIVNPPAHKRFLIEKAKSDDSPVSTKVKTEKYTDTLRELLVVPTNHYCMLQRKVKSGLQKTLNKESAHVLGEELGLMASEVIACRDSYSVLRLWDKRRSALVSDLVCCLRKHGLLASLHILYSDSPSVRLSDDEALAAERAFITGCSKGKHDDVQENQEIENQVVEDGHIDVLKYEVIGNAEVLHDFARHLLGWSFNRVDQFLNDIIGSTTSTKFFRVVKKWTDDKGVNATVQELLKAFEKIGKEGDARRVLSKLTHK